MFVNKVKNSGILPLDLIDFRTDLEIVSFDIKNLLFQGLIVKEKEFKAALAAVDMANFAGKAVAFTCSTDAIIPSWIYLSLADKFHKAVAYYDFKTVELLRLDLWKKQILAADFSSYKDQKVVIRDRKSTRLNSSHVKISYA